MMDSCTLLFDVMAMMGGYDPHGWCPLTVVETTMTGWLWPPMSLVLQLWTCPCVILCIYIGWMIIKYCGCCCLVSLIADIVTDGSRYDSCRYGRATSSCYFYYWWHWCACMNYMIYWWWWLLLSIWYVVSNICYIIISIILHALHSTLFLLHSDIPYYYQGTNHTGTTEIRYGLYLNMPICLVHLAWPNP